MKPIHNRLPVILGADSWDVWFDPKVKQTAELVALFRPCPAPACAFFCKPDTPGARGASRFLPARPSIPGVHRMATVESELDGIRRKLYELEGENRRLRTAGLAAVVLGVATAVALAVAV